MERIQKILAAGGIASRRAAEKLITAGRVRVNGRVVTELGAKGVATDTAVARVSVIGAGMKSHPGVAATVFETLASIGA